jgi:RimJ/RimL family protein N-acetyltransferase
MNINLHLWRADEIDRLVLLANNPKIARYLRDHFPHPYTHEAGAAWIARTHQDQPQRVFAIEYEGEPVGSIGIHPKTDIARKNAELGYWLGEPYWGRGIMTEAIRQIVDYGFQTFDLTRIFAIPFGDNIGSQKALEKAGFVLEAQFEKTLYKNGEFKDEWVYAVRSEGAL